MNPDTSTNGHAIDPTSPFSTEHRLAALEAWALQKDGEGRATGKLLDRLLESITYGRPTGRPISGQQNAFFQKPSPTLEESISLFRTAAEIKEAGLPEISYLIEDLIPEEALILISGAAKGGGKTTFTVHMAKALLSGTSFLDQPAAETSVVYLTEQPTGNFFNSYLAPVGIDGDEHLHLIFGYQTAGISWPCLFEAAVEKCRRVGARLLVVDTFMHFAGLKGEEENSSGAVQEALKPLQHAVAKHGLTIIVIHHDRKSGGDVYNAGRGSGAFQGIADLIVNLTIPPGNHRPTIREMRTIGRYSDVPEQLMIELADDHYRALGSERAVAGQAARTLALQIAPSNEGDAVRASELVKAAKERDPYIAKSTFRNELNALVGCGLLRSIGSGKKGDPYRYYRPLEEQR